MVRAVSSTRRCTSRWSTVLTICGATTHAPVSLPDCEHARTEADSIDAHPASKHVMMDCMRGTNASARDVSLRAHVAVSKSCPDTLTPLVKRALIGNVTFGPSKHAQECMLHQYEPPRTSTSAQSMRALARVRAPVQRYRAGDSPSCPVSPPVTRSM
jgi:hypothetical protein